MWINVVWRFVVAHFNKFSQNYKVRSTKRLEIVLADRAQLTIFGYSEQWLSKSRILHLCWIWQSGYRWLWYDPSLTRFFLPFQEEVARIWIHRVWEQRFSCGSYDDLQPSQDRVSFVFLFLFMYYINKFTEYLKTWSIPRRSRMKWKSAVHISQMEDVIENLFAKYWLYFANLQNILQVSC